MTIKDTCKDCVDRSVGCHSTCRKYLDAKAEYEAKKNEMIENQRVDKLMDSVWADAVKKAKKKKRKIKRR